MLHTYLAAPFSSPARQQQFEAVVAALQAEAAAPATLLLGNVAAPGLGPEPLDAVLLRPRNITILQLLPTGGLLHVPALRTGPWLLDGAPLELPSPSENPFLRFEQQRAALAQWLGPHLAPEAANLQFITGLVLFGAPVRFGPEVEARMAAVPAASAFHLLADPARFTRRLAQLATPEIDLTPAELTQLAQALHLGAEPDPTAPTAEPAPKLAAPAAGASHLLRQKAGQLWRWLGAEDVDELDRRSTGYEVDLEARHQEKEQLEHLRTSLQADLTQQLHTMEAREAEREQRIHQLQQQLAATPVAPEAPTIQAQLATEKQEKEVLEASIREYRAELESRNQELGSKIQQLETLIERLATAPVSPAPPPLASPSPITTPSATSAPPATPTPPPAAAPAPEVSAAPVASPRREPIGRPRAARPAGWMGLERWQPAWRRLRSRLAAWLSRARAQPRLVRYAAAGAAGLVLAVGMGRCGSGGVPVPFQQQGRYGLLTAGGDTLVPARYTSIGTFVDGRAVVEQEGVFGFVQDDGREVIKPAYDALFPYAEGYARARVGALYTFLDAEGEEFGAYYYAARDFREGYAAVLDHRGWHYLTGPTEPASAPVIFQEAYSFEHKLARVKTANFFTFIRPDYLADTTEGTGPFGRYTSATDFDEQGRARVVQHGRSFLIDREGEEVQ